MHFSTRSAHTFEAGEKETKVVFDSWSRHDGEIRNRVIISRRDLVHKTRKDGHESLFTIFGRGALVERGLKSLRSSRFFLFESRTLTLFRPLPPRSGPSKVPPLLSKPVSQTSSEKKCLHNPNSPLETLFSFLFSSCAALFWKAFCSARRRDKLSGKKAATSTKQKMKKAVSRGTWEKIPRALVRGIVAPFGFRARGPSTSTLNDFDWTIDVNRMPRGYVGILLLAGNRGDHSSCCWCNWSFSKFSDLWIAR